MHNVKTLWNSRVWNQFHPFAKYFSVSVVWKRERLFLHPVGWKASVFDESHVLSQIINENDANPDENSHPLQPRPPRSPMSQRDPPFTGKLDCVNNLILKKRKPQRWMNSQMFIPLLSDNVVNVNKSVFSQRHSPDLIPPSLVCAPPPPELSHPWPLPLVQPLAVLCPDHRATDYSRLSCPQDNQPSFRPAEQSRAQTVKVQNTCLSGRARRDWLLSYTWQMPQERDLVHGIHRTG